MPVSHVAAVASGTSFVTVASGTYFLAVASGTYFLAVASGFSRKIMMLAILICAPSFAAGQKPIPAKLEPLAWLTGCWQITRGDQVIDEQWMAPRAGVMLAMSRTVRAGRATSTEFVTLRIVDGRVVYEANPSAPSTSLGAGRKPTSFPATAVSADRAVFENPAHDYPKRIIYERQGDTGLIASIDDGAGRKRVEYPFQRVACR